MNKYLLCLSFLFSVNSFSNEHNSNHINKFKITGFEGEIATNSEINISFDYDIDKESLIFIRPTCQHSFEICDGGGGRGAATYLGRGSDTSFIYMTKPTIVTGLQYKIVDQETRNVIYSGQLPVNIPVKNKS
ncbi:hypothetical protein [Vibrio hepatarius]|uniref:hypothetical protein n=1 Tax=Vibrio hepatarius TaxID=171383 RepID=UPI001C08A781|nr:hypothetical protein [Vibrio hepatarius]MBU2898096.1 hypothetical protein [Vibrio hepatarius]